MGWEKNGEIDREFQNFWPGVNGFLARIRLTNDDMLNKKLNLM